MINADIDYPDHLPCPIRQGYDINHENPILRTSLQGGRARQRLMFTSVPSIVSVAFVFLNDEQAADFEWWFHDSLGDGIQWFNMPLKTPVGEKEYVARFTKMYSGPTLTGASAWKFAAEIELWERPLKQPDPDPTPEFLYTFTAQDVSDLTSQGLTFRVNDALQTEGFSLRDGDILQIVAPDGYVWDSPSRFAYNDPLLGEMVLNLGYDEGSSVSRVAMYGAGSMGDKAWESFTLGDIVEIPGPSLDFIAAALDAINGEVIT